MKNLLTYILKKFKKYERFIYHVFLSNFLSTIRMRNKSQIVSLHTINCQIIIKTLFLSLIIIMNFLFITNK